MSSVSIAGDTSGSILLAAPAVAGSTTINIAAQSGTLNVAGPAFSAYTTSSQVLSSGSTTKILFPLEQFDTNNNFASSRFTPTVAGYYQLNVNIGISGGASTQQLVSIYKNGAVYKHLQDANSSTYGLLGSCLVNANGTTDYFEVFVYTATGFTVVNIAEYTWFDGCFLRGA